MTAFLRLSAFSLLLAGLAGAQNNLVADGDFEKGLGAWQGTGPGTVIGVVPYDVDLDGKSSQAFQMHPGGNVYAPPHAPYILSQDVIGVPVISCLFECDVRVEASANNSQGGLIELWLGNQKVYEFTKYAGSISAGTNFSARISGVVKFPIAGKQKLELHIARPKYTQHTGTPKWTIDNVRLYLGARAPFAHCREPRPTGGQFQIEIEGQPAAAAALFLSVGLLPTPISIPGIGGALELDLTTLTFLGSGLLDKNGAFSMNVPIPAAPALKGLKVSFQAAQADTSGITLGTANRDLPIQ